ncbi:MAG: hypothetical protein IMZ53_01485 [Thermoplasmata archaeon]|nr:hypothetical protein [Thermoplasmata archaeon]
MKTFSELLTAHVIQLQQEQGRLINQKQLAGLLVIGETSLNLAWNGKRPPSKTLVEKCAVYFNDMRFYDAARMERPEPLLAYTRRNWGSVPGESKKKIAEEVAQYSNEPLPKDDVMKDGN